MSRLPTALLLAAALVQTGGAGCGGRSDQPAPRATAQAPAPAAAPAPDAHAPISAADANPRFRCVGNEPGWTLTISPDSLVFVGDYGEVRAAYAGVAPKIGDGMWYYESVNRSAPSGYSRLTAIVLRESCSDGMSDRSYEYTVRVIHDLKAYVGCGTRL